ncbi:MAG: hypothetical protein J0H39_13950 [Alphaproteobacteria bacterium]|nr:hypothetical protein [Alphaproteobacteria bacterium]
MSLRDNESGENDVRYVVACDVDDKATIGTLYNLQAKLPLGYRVGECPVSLDALHNRICRDVPGDVYACFIDDAICLSKDWDKPIAEAWRANPKGLWWWKSKGDDLTLAPITSHAWFEAAGERIFPEHFPFWWGDTWLSEVWVLATERNLAFVDAEFLDCPKKTGNMRELKFWHDFYLWLQPQRIAEAKAIAARLGFPAPTITGALAQIVGAPNPDFVKRIDQIEATQGDTSPPHAGYLECKARAQAMMAGAEPPAVPEIAIDDLLTPEVIAVLNKHFPGFDAPEPEPIRQAREVGRYLAENPAARILA